MFNGARGRGQGPEKSKDFVGATKRLIKELGKTKVLLILALVLSVASTLCETIAPSFLAKLTDQIELGLRPDSVINIDAVTGITIALGSLYILCAVLGYFSNVSMVFVTNRFANRMRDRISKKINKMPLKYFDRKQIGDILSRITNDVDTIVQNLSNSLSSLVSDFVMVVGIVVMMFVTNWMLAIVAIVACLIGFSFSGIILKKSQKYFIMRQEELGKLNSHIEESYSGLNIIKAYNGKAEVDAKFDRCNRSVFEAESKSQFLSGLMHPIMHFISNIGYVAVCIVGAIMAANGYITFGVIVAFMTYVKLFTNPLTDIAQQLTGLQSAAAAGERVFEFLDEAEMPDQSKLTEYLNKDEVEGNIEFNHVHFGYNEDRVIIQDFSADVKAGQKVAIVGPTGAGKTTMINLLMKFYDVNSGDIRIDGVSCKHLTRENIHSLFTMVLQDTWTFEGTIRENIVYNAQGVSDERIMEVCDIVGLSHFIKTLPEGLDTDMGENCNISAGQKQLLTIARGMIEKAPFLILDEATSNVDTRTEELVQKAMDKLTEGRTSFIIAHRLSTIKNADLILVMKNGNIVESGTHKQLMRKNGAYAELYNSQFSL